MNLKRLAALAVALLMLLGMLPSAALADTDECRGNNGGPHHWLSEGEDPADCQHEGVRWYYCTFCGASKNEVIPKTSHNYSGWQVTRQATCTTTGERQRICYVCGSVQEEAIPTTEHSWGGWQVTRQATCMSTGERQRACTVCGTVQRDSTAKAEHSWGGWETLREATCTAPGERQHRCRVCGETRTETVPQTPHTWGEWAIITEATDHSSGTRARTCQVCGAQETEDYDPEGTLRRGASGDAVQRLQEALICYGAMSAGGADGNFGPGTEQAVMQVQTAEGLTPDGVAWPQTQARLGHRFGDWTTVSTLSDFSKGMKQRVCARCGYAETEEEWPEPLFRRGDRGEGVRALQQALNDTGYDCGTPDGDFGRRTETAVSAFESANGLPADGIAWPGVLKLLGFSGNAADLSGLTRSPKNPHALNLTGVQVSPEQDQYYEGDFVSFRLVLTNNSGQKLRGYTLYAVGDNNPWTNGQLYGAAGNAGLETGASYAFGTRLEQLTHAAAEKGEYTAAWFVGATLEDGTYVKSNEISFAIAPVLSEDARPETGAAIALDMEQTSAARAVYELGADGNSEAITYNATVTNTGGEALLFKTLRVFRDGDKRFSWPAVDLDEPVRLEPGEAYAVPVSETLAWSYMRAVDAEAREKQGCDGVCELRFEAYGLAPETGAISCRSDVAAFEYFVAAARETPENTPRLALAAAAKPQCVVEGGALEISFCATNTGSVPLEEVSFSLGAESEADMTLDDLALSAEQQTLQPGESTSLTYTYTVPGLKSTGSTLTLNLLASGWYDEGGESKLVNSLNIRQTITVLPAGEPAEGGPELRLWLSTDGGYLMPGDKIYVDMMVENTGTEILKDVYFYYVMTSDDGDLIEEGPLSQMVTDTEFRPGEEMFGSLETVMPEYAVTHGAAVVNFVAHGKRLSGEEVTSEPEVAYYPAVGMGGTGAGEAAIFLQAEPLVQVAPGDASEAEAAITLSNTGSVPLALKSIEPSANGEIRDLTWTEGTLEPAESCSFNLRISLNEGWGPWTYGWVLATAEDPNTGETAECYLRVFVMRAEAGSGFTLLPEDTTGRTGKVGATIPVLFYFANTGDRALSDLRFAYGDGAGKTFAAESVTGAPSQESLLAPGAAFAFFYNVVLSPEDEAAGIAHRQLTAFARDAETGEEMERSEGIALGVLTGDAAGISIYKDTLSHPAEGEAFGLDEVITYRIHVTNNTDADIYDVEVYDPLHGSNEDMMVDLLQPLPANSTHTTTFDYTVTQEDVNRGYILNQASVVWTADGEQCEAKSNELVLSTVAAEDHGVSVVKSASGAPAEPEGYQEGETISYTITVVNETGAYISDVQIYDPLHGGNEDMMVDLVPSMGPGESHTASFDYTVTAEDVARAFVANQAQVTWVGGSGQEGSAVSNAVVVPVIPARLPPPVTVHVDPGILVGKFQWNLPADDSGYALGETMEYRIILDNMTDQPISGITVHDPQEGLLEGSAEGSYEVASLAPQEEVRLKFEHVVTQEDVDRGYVDNYAYVLWPGESEYDQCTAQSENVRLKTIGGTPKAVETPAISIVKSEISIPAEPNGYQLNERIDFRIDVTNESEAVIDKVTVYDHANEAESGAWAGEIVNLQPHETQSVYWSYYVTEADMARLYMTNYASGVWTDPAAGGERTAVSNTVLVYTYVEGDPPVEWYDLDIKKEEYDLPDNGAFYVEGEEVTFRITVRNDTPVRFTNLKITDSLCPGNGHVLAEYDHLDPEGEIVEYFTYTVTGADVDAGSVVNTAGVTAADDLSDNHTSESGEVSVPTGRDEDVLTVHKTEISAPANSKFYSKGEEIVYRISVINETDKVISLVEMHDILMPGDGLFDTINDFQPHDSRTYDLKYTVQQGDVEACSVWNVAYAVYLWDDAERTAFSEEVESPTGVKISMLTTKPAPRAEGDHCVPTLLALGSGQAEYALDYCGVHGGIADQVKALVQQAGTDEAALAAWQQAEQLWTDAVNAEYEALMSVSQGERKLAVLSERLMFFADLSCRRKALALEAPDAPAEVCRRLSELLMNKCAELCYEAHTAPEDRADSRYRDGVRPIGEQAAETQTCARQTEETATGVAIREQACLKHRALDAATAAILGEAQTAADRLQALRLARQWWQTELDRMWAERYQAAAPEERIVVAQEKGALEHWLRERERLLDQLYPDRPEIAAEVTARHVIARALDLCADQGGE